MSTTTEEIWIDDQAGDDAVDSLYRSSVVARGVAGFGAIGDAHLLQFRERGYLVINNAFTQVEVDAALEGLLDLIDGKNPEYRRGIQYEGRARDIIHTLPREKKQDAVRKLWKFVDYEPCLRAIAYHPQLLATIARLMDDTPELFQDQALLKPPFIGREKPWHQDNAYFNLPPATTVVGVWIALDEALPENGCMYIIPGSHRDGPVVHFKRRDWQICDTDVAVDRSVVVPLKPGSCLLFHGLLHHGTPTSRSERRRRALQFHYKPASIAPIDVEARLAVFGSEGKDVTC